METVLLSLVRGSVCGRPLHTLGLAARAHPLRLFAACKPYLALGLVGSYRNLIEGQGSD